ncbi:hypothetical protein B0I37DRAFT_14151 [Chaetomium sp. MPI-CAGE-AT-0009]|nr:hypothetical protein B0I37DRAFT_14151 [Chaetomium sp. MPI-CAGE-AT-0009]
MRIRQPTPPSTLAHKPQLHTHKNHHTYNGIRRLPQSTHVRVITHHPANNNTPSSSTTPTGTTTTGQTNADTDTDADTPRYVITLHYAHNRACELYRTAYDIAMLRRELAVLKHPITWGTSSSKTGPGIGSSGDADAAAVTGERGGGQCRTACTRSCSCPCPCVEQGCDARDAAGVQSMLGEALGKMKARDTRAEVPLEWFLKRRIGDCGGR